VQVHGHISSRGRALASTLQEVQQSLHAYAELGDAFQQVGTRRRARCDSIHCL